MINPAKTAPIARKQLTDTNTNHVNSKPNNVVDLLSENYEKNNQKCLASSKLKYSYLNVAY